MKGLFSPNSKFMRFMSRIADLMILNFLTLITSLPVFTIGAAQTALYTVCIRFDTPRETGVFHAYFDAFKENFKQATILWLLLLLFGGTAAFNTLAFYLMPGYLHWLFPFFALLLVIVLLTATMVFPLLSQFDNKTSLILKNSLILSLGFLPKVLLATAFNVLPWILLLAHLIVFMQAGILWITVYFAAAAYANSLILRNIFARLTDDQPKLTTEEDPL